MSGPAYSYNDGYADGLKAGREAGLRRAAEILMAQAYHKGKGAYFSSQISIKDAMKFATEIVRQALLADGHDESEIGEIKWVSPVTLADPK